MAKSQQIPDSLNAKGHCSRQVSASEHVALLEQFKARLKASTTIIVNKSGGWCGDGLSYRLEKLASAEALLFLRTHPDPFEQETPVSLNESRISALRLAIDALTISSVDPLGCSIGSDGCNDSVVLKVGEESFAYRPEFQSSYTHSEAFITDESFKSVLKMLAEISK